ncbi:zinc finger CCCH domain-containing protein 6 isoform X1 [Beta vulgaris subsp. vulgaris]|uniref:zinc finger CCCH domain-containing protein 6 isoform X1 n=1 Tax=Beta vulgaris subsp. vulgaris TaxID=3555 RepID=UPI0020370ADE|nr:zinc finger CCCH domain-containing protein 6 isoform X1 [Beta vulgaris subsp. vulgaris]XP_048493756.1 zinc finger CCCH domain-containing protein 6 isoform X1 [Beta vulgaris subsp. vulgaris]
MPTKICNKAEDHPQGKTFSMLQQVGMGFDDPPSGFGGNEFSETSRRTPVPQIKWNCPPMFILKNDWHVVAGEFSEEIWTQKCRQMEVLEAVYPHPCDVPPSPSVSPGLEKCDCDDHKTPVIPLIPIEEEGAVDHESPPCPIHACSNSVAMKQDDVEVRLAEHNTPEKLKVIINEKPIGLSTGLDADIVAAASAAFTAIMKCNEQGSLIDTDLLVKILSDPKMIEGLPKVVGVSLSTKITPIYDALKLATASVPSPTKVQSTVLQKPLDETFTMQNFVEQKVRLASDTFLISETIQVPTLPLSEAKPLPSAQANEFSNQSNSTSWAPMSNQESPLDLPSRPGYLLKNCQPNMVLSIEKENQSLPLEVHPVRSSSQSSYSPVDGLVASSVSVKTPLVKDLNYYKSLIKLHGTESQASQEEHIQQYRFRASKLTAASGQGDVKAKIQRPCKFLNSSRGCRKGVNCPFQHDSLLKPRAGSIPDTHSSKKLKIGK